MSTKAKQLIENIKDMSVNERAAIAQLIIESLDASPDSGVEQAWIELAEARLKEIEQGRVSTVSWEHLKRNLRTYNEKN